MLLLRNQFKRRNNGTKLAWLVALMLALPATAGAVSFEKWPQPVRIVTASPGGTYFSIGTQLANFIRQHFGIESTVLVTGGPYHNMGLIHFGAAELGFVTAGPAHESWHGENPTAPGIRMQRVRVLFAMYRTPFHFAVKAESGIRTFSNLEGRTIGIGPYEGTPGTYYPRFFREFGIAANWRHASFSEFGADLTAGRIDAIGLAGGVPVPVFADIDQPPEIRILGFEDDTLMRLLGRHPFLSRDVIPAGAYPDQATPVDTVSMWNFVVAPASLPAEVAYRITKTFLTLSDRRRFHPAIRGAHAGDALQNRFLLFHPGALKFYREQQIPIYQELIPLEATKGKR